MNDTPPIGAGLVEAYRDSVYWLRIEPTPVAIRIGEPNPELDALLQRLHARRYAVVSAHNPRSLLLRPDENAARQENLRRHLEQQGYDSLLTEAMSGRGDWPPEIGHFIIGITQREALRVARDYQQNAIVYGELGQAPRLLLALESCAGQPHS